MKKTLNEKEAALYVGMSVSFLRIARMEGDRKNRTAGPSYVKIGRSVRYLISDLDSFLEKNRKVSCEIEST